MEWLMPVGSILLSLTVTFLFNYFVGLPKKWKQAKNAEKKEKEYLIEDNKKRDARIVALEEVVDMLPKYRQQSIKIQEELKRTDINIIEICNSIKNDVMQNREKVLEKLERLENREKNSLRAKILEEYRLYIDISKNPTHAWSEMEAHSFFKLIEDYEELGGNDYIHEVVIPEINHLNIIPMSDLGRLKELYHSREIK